MIVDDLGSTIDPALARRAVELVRAEAARSAAAIKSKPGADDEVMDFGQASVPVD